MSIMKICVIKGDFIFLLYILQHLPMKVLIAVYQISGGTSSHSQCVETPIYTHCMVDSRQIQVKTQHCWAGPDSAGLLRELLTSLLLSNTALSWPASRLGSQSLMDLRPTPTRRLSFQSRGT